MEHRCLQEAALARGGDHLARRLGPPKAPCYSFIVMDRAYGRVKRLDMPAGFEEIPDKHAVAGM